MAKKETASKKDLKELCRLITPEFRVSYPHLFKAQAPDEKSKKKFSITMLFPKNKELVGQSPTGEERSLKSIMRNAKNAYFGSKENWPEGLLSPIKDGDDPEFADKEGYKGHWVIKATTNEDQRPGVVDRDMTPITEPSELYPGCYARAYIYAYVWEPYMKKQGVGFILDHVQKLRDGKSFSAKKPVEQVFAPLEALDDEDTASDDDDDDVGDF